MGGRPKKNVQNFGGEPPLKSASWKIKCRLEDKVQKDFRKADLMNWIGLN
jgi:hypothetical protein